MSITVTSATSIAAFLFGSATSIPAIQWCCPAMFDASVCHAFGLRNKNVLRRSSLGVYSAWPQISRKTVCRCYRCTFCMKAQRQACRFCWYAAVCVFFAWLLQITFFLAGFALIEKRFSSTSYFLVPHFESSSVSDKSKGSAPKLNGAADSKTFTRAAENGTATAAAPVSHQSYHSVTEPMSSASSLGHVQHSALSGRFSKLSRASRVSTESNDSALALARRPPAWRAAIASAFHSHASWGSGGAEHPVASAPNPPPLAAPRSSTPSEPLQRAGAFADATVHVSLPEDTAARLRQLADSADVAAPIPSAAAASTAADTVGAVVSSRHTFDRRAAVIQQPQSAEAVRRNVNAVHDRSATAPQTSVIDEIIRAHRAARATASAPKNKPPAAPTAAQSNPVVALPGVESPLWDSNEGATPPLWHAQGATAKRSSSGASTPAEPARPLEATNGAAAHAQRHSGSRTPARPTMSASSSAGALGGAPQGGLRRNDSAVRHWHARAADQQSLANPAAVAAALLDTCDSGELTSASFRIELEPVAQSGAQRGGRAAAPVGEGVQSSSDSDEDPDVSDTLALMPVSGLHSLFTDAPASAGGGTTAVRSAEHPASALTVPGSRASVRCQCARCSIPESVCTLVSIL